LKAFMVYEPHRFGLVEAPMPMIADDEVLVKVRAAAICHSDLDIIEGRRRHSLKLPVITGHEFSGEIAELGKNVTGLSVGLKVACECIVWCGSCRACLNGETSCCENFDELGTMRSGGFAEYTAVPAKMVHPIKNLSFEEASNIEPAGNGCHCAQAAEIRNGDTVVVIGPGPIGLYAMQFAKLYSPGKLIMAGTRENRLAVAKELGATHTVNIRECDPYEIIMKITGGKGADRVLQCATTDDAMTLGLRLLNTNSVMAIEGYGDDEPIQLRFSEFVKKPMCIKGVSGVTEENYIATIRVAEEGKIQFKPIITHTFSLDDMEKALETMTDKSQNAIKIVIKP